jgi:alkaline phosphatase D
MKINVRTDVAADVEIEYATNPNFNNSTTTTAVGTVAADDFTTTVELTGLAADTMHWYRILVDTVIQNTGYAQKVRTFPSGSATYKFGVFADVAPTDKVAACYQSGKDDGILFALQIGDFDHGNPATLAAMRAMHRAQRDPALKHGGDFTQHITSKMGLAHVWDDHDYGGDDENKNFAGRADAWQAFDEYYPGYSRPNADAGIWHSFVCGDAEFFMLDTRSQRDPDGLTDNANKSMLDGDNITNGQKQWLKDGLLNSTATWKFVISTVTANLTARPSSNDHWASFSTERDELKDYLVDNSISNVVLLSADLHTGGGIDDGTNCGFGIPEVTVPHTNLNKGNTKNLGTWSEGVTSGAKGYAVVTVTATSVTLETKDHNGVLKHSLVLT